MSFLFLMLGFSLVAYIPQLFLGDRRDYRMALRHGMAGGFTFTGIDHFVNAETRYLPMVPDFLADHALQLVYFTGVAELAGAIGLVVPLAIYKRLGLPNLRKWAGIGLAIMLALLVVANVNIALKGGSVQGLEFGAWYYWVRPLFQPIFILWALHVSGVVWDKRSDLRARHEAAQRRPIRTRANNA
jgi:uncharacterized membrane protein